MTVMGHKERLRKNEKRNRKEEPKYFKELIEVISTVETYKRQVYEVEHFENEWIKIDIVTLPKFSGKIFIFWELSKLKLFFDVKI